MAGGCYGLPFVLAGFVSLAGPGVGEEANLNMLWLLGSDQPWSQLDRPAVSASAPCP